MVIGCMVLFAVVGVALTTVRAVRRQWFGAVQAAASTALAEAAYSAMILHNPWISAATDAAGVLGSVGLLFFGRRRTPRSTEPTNP